MNMPMNPTDSPFSTFPAQRFCAPSDTEPIATPTIAGIYLRQGLPHRALKVYRDLLQADPRNDSLRFQLEELEARLHAEEEQMRQELESPAQESTSDRPTTTVAQREIALLTHWFEAARRRKRHVS